jgi:hypothetical protein
VRRVNGDGEHDGRGRGQLVAGGAAEVPFVPKPRRLHLQVEGPLGRCLPLDAGMSAPSLVGGRHPGEELLDLCFDALRRGAPQRSVPDQVDDGVVRDGDSDDGAGSADDGGAKE